jgi:predicted Zn-dependent protease
MIQKSRFAAVSALLAVAIAAAPGLAHAEWRKAETRHFVVYGNGFERDLRDYATELERIDQLMRTYFALPEQPDQRKLPVYIVRNRADLRIVAPELPERVAGFYSANFRDIRAVAIRSAGDETLRHEYGHHFMFRNFPGAYPAWFREGFAEFFSTATVSASGRATVGKTPFSSARVLNTLRWLPMETVLGGAPNFTDGRETAAFYAQSWLLMHWTMTDPDRRRRMDAYMGDRARGVAIDAALRSHFDTDAEQLGRTLRAYLDAGPRYAELDLGSADPALSISALPDSADEVLLVDVNARDGGPANQGPAVLASARQAAERRPGDLLAQSAAARAELRWGDPARAEAAIQPLLDARPTDVELLLLMADARITAGDKLTDPEARERLYRQARGFLARAFEADPGNHWVYQSIAYSRRFAADYPTENDVELWRRAVAIAPEVVTNRPVAAEAMLAHGLVDEAEQVIQPIANDPHGGETSPRVQRILARIAQVRGGSSAGPPAPAASPPEAVDAQN